MYSDILAVEDLLVFSQSNSQIRVSVRGIGFTLYTIWPLELTPGLPGLLG